MTMREHAQAAQSVVTPGTTQKPIQGRQEPAVPVELCYKSDFRVFTT